MPRTGHQNGLSHFKALLFWAEIWSASEIQTRQEKGIGVWICYAGGSISVVGM